MAVFTLDMTSPVDYLSRNIAHFISKEHTEFLKDEVARSTATTNCVADQ